MIRRPLLTLLLSTLAASEALAEPTNQAARNLSRQLAPTPAARSANAGDLGNLRQRMIALIEVLEASNRSNGSGPESLIAKAYDFRDDVGNLEEFLTSTAILNAWREAHARGLFNELGKFNGEITKGRGIGGECIFELVVPAEVYPPGSNQIANVRLVPVEAKRNTGSDLDNRDAAFHRELEKMIAEKAIGAKVARFENPPSTNALGQSEKEALAQWEKAMAEAGEAGKGKPNIRIESRVSGTPSHMTQDRWRTTTDIVNFSSHPTEIVVEIYLLGNTDKKRDYYLMAKSSHTLKLRANEARTIETFTKAQGSYKNAADNQDGLSKEERQKSKVRFRGYVVLARHGEDVVTFVGSDQRLAEFGNPEAENSPLGRLPAF